MTPSWTGRVRPPRDLLLAREVEATALVAGRWSLSLRGAELDDISCDGVLVLRSIRLIVRDEDWGTMPMQLDGAEPQHDDGTGSVVTLRGRAGGVCSWTLSVRIDDGTLQVSTRVEATGRFLRNRLGLIVLHPPQLAGRPLAVDHPDGSTTTTPFPEHISPHQPARDIRALSWLAGAGDDGPAVGSVLRFRGDVFEMEDQRNWTDASFKTYSTPLSIPFPVELEPGEVVEQSVEVHCMSTDPAGAPTVNGETESPIRARVTFGAPDASMPLPAVTTSVSSGPVAGLPLPAAFGPLLCELDPGTANWRAVLDRAVTESGGLPLDLRLIVGNADETDPVLDHLVSAGVAAARIGVFDRLTHLSEPALLAEVRKRLDDRGITAQLLGGTRAHFTELNRNHSRLRDWDGPLTFSITPFMHDRGGHQLVESLAMQRLVALEALAIADGRPVHIGPITLGARFNAVATSAPPVPLSVTLDGGFGAELVDGATDIRQAARSLGAWVLASVAALAVDGVMSVSYFEASGSRGLLDGDGHETSAGVLLEWIAELAGGAVARLESDHPAVVGLAVSKPGDGEHGSVGLVGNLGDVELTVEIDGVDAFALEPGEVKRVSARVE